MPRSRASARRVRNALDAAGMATARRILEGATDDQLRSLRPRFLQRQSRRHQSLQRAADGDAAKQQLRRRHAEAAGDAQIRALLPARRRSAARQVAVDDVNLSFVVKSGIRLKNTLEVALVLDNSGSMSEKGSGTGQKRIDLAQGRLQAACRHARRSGRADEADRRSRSSSDWCRSRHRSMSGLTTTTNPGWTPAACRRSITRISTGRR